MHWILNRRINEAKHLVVMTWRGILAWTMVRSWMSLFDFVFLNNLRLLDDWFDDEGM